MEFKGNDFQANEILKFIRQNADLTQKELANILNKSTNQVKNNEQGLNRYYFEDLIKISNICNVEIIFKEKKKKKNQQSKEKHYY